MREFIDNIAPIVGTAIKILIYGVSAYLLISIFVPSMGFWNSVSNIFSFLFIDIPSAIFGFFIEGQEMFKEMGKQDGNTWASFVGVFLVIIGLVVSLLYYLAWFLAYAVWADDGKPASAMWKNELNWMLGLTTNKDIIKAEVQANEIVDALERRSK